MAGQSCFLVCERTETGLSLLLTFSNRLQQQQPPDRNCVKRRFC